MMQYHCFSTERSLVTQNIHSPVQHMVYRQAARTLGTQSLPPTTWSQRHSVTWRIYLQTPVPSSGKFNTRFAKFAMEF